MNTISLLLTIAATMALPDASVPHKTFPSQPVLENCLVSLIEEAEVPGGEAGALIELTVKEGSLVKKDQEIGRIEDSKAVALKRVKEKEYEAAEEQAKDEINKQFYEASAGVAKYAYQQLKKANAQSAKSVADVELRKSELEWKKAELQVEKADLDKKVAGLTAETKLAEVAATEADIQLRRIVSPLDGVVVKVYKHRGEWVPPGEPVVHVVGVDRLRVQGYVSAEEFGPEEINKRDVIVETVLARGRKMQFKGKIVFVSPIVDRGAKYVVFAEVDNKQEAGQWLLRPGVTATMTIQTK